MILYAAIGSLLAAFFKPLLERIGEKIRDKLMPEKKKDPEVGTAGNRRVRRAQESKRRHRRGRKR